MSDDDPLDNLAKRVRAAVPRKRVAKATRTLSLTEPNFTIIQSYCRTKGLTTSDVIDEIIEAFLRKIADDLPPDDRERIETLAK